MHISKEDFKKLIRGFEFTVLFNRLGWNFLKETQPVKIKDTTYNLDSVAEKSGFRILVCHAGTDGLIPDYPLRLKIDKAVSRLFNKHLVIYVDRNNSEQLWQYVLREPGKPLQLTETRWDNKKDPELLFQKTSSLFFTLDEEEKNITILDVTDRVNENFHQNNEKVTKKFYEGFKAEHGAFLGFIKGITETVNTEWYASLMLNRLMFCYFIQKKGFLDNNKNYLRDKLKECQEKQGKTKFYSFYRSFLLALFHEGLGKPEPRVNFPIDIGRIPYLNGGLFDVHELEVKYRDIHIDDKAFERVFIFFDKYEWHLDTRKEATGKDINPDVIGYIFEKYINERAEMGAYYTKEDITAYIGRNSILPDLFEKIKGKFPAAFEEHGEILGLVKESGDRYIYKSVRHGVNSELPREIKKGVSDFSARGEWMKQAPGEFALPTEIWREVIHRRKRHKELKAKISKGDVRHTNDFIRYNLDIGQFLQDMLENVRDPSFIESFYEILTGTTILDPTCGSGAFLFAALNVLEPLYDACISRMSAFVEDEDRLNRENKKVFLNNFAFFREILENMRGPQHNNQQYFIYKTIILRNLYGVDMMNEAVEIAKLRLFLKLVATVEADHQKPNLGIEPLPDIDFNIRTGNTLVGFATEGELKTELDGKLDVFGKKEDIEEQCEKVAMAFKRFKDIQLTHGDDYLEFKKAKEELSSTLKELNNELNRLFNPESSKTKYSNWLKQYKPFHWFSEFYEIIHANGGFDVIIGNPPYVEYSGINYKLTGYTTLSCGNIYAQVVERSLKLLHIKGKCGMIVPISSICTDRMIDYQKMILNKPVWNSLYAERPGKLFTGAEVQLVITLLSNSGVAQTYSTTYNKWGTEFRNYLFDTLSYTDISSNLRKGSFPKIGSETEKSILSKISKNTSTIGHLKRSAGNYFVSYRNAGGRYYKVVLNFEPAFKVDGVLKKSSTYQTYYLDDRLTADSLCALMNSSLFFWYWLVFSDTWHMVNREIGTFPIDFNDTLKEELSLLNKKLVADLTKNSETRKENRNKGENTIEYTQFKVRESKSILDQVDTVLAKHYRFTDEELDFIVNYDIKYRLGKEPED